MERAAVRRKHRQQKIAEKADSKRATGEKQVPEARSKEKRLPKDLAECREGNVCTFLLLKLTNIVAPRSESPRARCIFPSPPLRFLSSNML
jgi:hypothetical protein